MLITDHISHHNELVERRQRRICVRNLENVYEVVYYTTAKAAVPGWSLAQLSPVFMCSLHRILWLFLRVSSYFVKGPPRGHAREFFVARSKSLVSPVEQVASCSEHKEATSGLGMSFVVFSYLAVVDDHPSMLKSVLL